MSTEELISSPMMLAYAAAQAAAPDHFILYRVGEFYEVLGPDAASVSRILGLQLTRRRRKNADDLPMCGIPAGSVSQMTARLLSAGKKVAFSEQPLEQDGERPLRRQTPATSVDPDVVRSDRNNHLTVALSDGPSIAFAWIDLSTGETGTTIASVDAYGPALARIAPAEVLVARFPEGSEALSPALHASGIPFSSLPKAPPVVELDPDGILVEAYGREWRDDLKGFAPAELSALGVLLRYLRSTTGELSPGLPVPRRSDMSDTVQVDIPTLAGLEVFTSASGVSGSLLSVIDRTVTAAGARLLARQLAAPLTSRQQIGRRLAMIRFLIGNPQIRGDCREELSAMPDMLRACGRLSLGKGGPRDLGAVRDGLSRAMSLATRLSHAEPLPAGLASVVREIATSGEGSCATLAQDLRRALAGQLPKTSGEAGYISSGFDSKLDKARREAALTLEAIDALQGRYAAETGSKGLRIRSNSVLGHFVEVPSAQAAGFGTGFTLRQGLASSSRFSTHELDLLASRLSEATARVFTLEQRIFYTLSEAVRDAREGVRRIARAAAALDLSAGLAQAAAEGLWTEPELVDDPVLDIEGGRHPVSERLLEAQGRKFVPNDCRMVAEDRVWLLTGPNMAGKSTYLRQVALIVLMAQLGSYVPAERARIGMVDKLFSWIGASDDLASGRSTFMVEMLQTAAILTQSTFKSLVILDEVGRGTSTHDGLAIACATMEHLHDVVGCRTLFATHFHELADAADAMPRATCMAMDASAGRHEDVFTFKLSAGRAGQSYGLRTALLAGIPPSVLRRAEALLADYQSDAGSGPYGSKRLTVGSVSTFGR